MRNRAMPSHICLVSVFCVLTALISDSSATAQTGQITGTVSDELAAPAAGLTVQLSGGATVANVDFVLSPGGSISGSVFGLMPGETVNLQAYDALSGRYRGGFDSDAGFN